MWTLDEAATFCHDLLPAVKAVGYYVGVTGSVLYGDARASSHDLDLIIYPTSTVHSNADALTAALTAHGMRRLYDVDVVQARWRKLGSDDEKHVEVWAWGRKRVDLFFLR
jgi:predicted nucleotidyltransferase